MDTNKLVNTYTVNKLQTYDECPQRYKLCYIDNVKILENPIFSKKAEKGNNLHNLINFYLKGQNTSKLVTALTHNEKILWINFKESEIKNYNIRESEYAFNVKIDEYWLTGRIDALFEHDNKYIILDWKTGENFKGNQVKFQTAFYLLSIYEILKAKRLIKSPEQIELHYMNIATNTTIRIQLDENKYIQYRTKILEIINKINTNPNFFCHKSDQCKTCKYCRACPYY